jgi:hypothetical protein
MLPLTHVQAFLVNMCAGMNVLQAGTFHFSCGALPTTGSHIAYEYSTAVLDGFRGFWGR